ncbi:hypothetical protein L6452_30713 [Arctium lappa]|uniref:Uncharacterized protein n=1 Tax=Arctium lappa TaxID=4217 RepID=A0ACB8ZJ45_ARCLA|nr:hypothetical protein L6452_30713 [Arctium lappa]
MNRFLIIVVIICFHAAISTSKERVEYLPGFQGPLPFHLETGYVGVDENEDVQLFYYFIQSESNPKDDPLMLWLTGGPGCSSISGLLYEFGPIQFKAEHLNGSLPTLVLRPQSWTKMTSVIFLDIPVGTGFSYARTERASHSTDLQYAKHGYEFIIKWLNSHPEFISNPFYVGGNSFSGHPVPIISQLISNGNEGDTKPYINLKGYVLGNALAFPTEKNFQKQFANGMGLIPDELYKSIDGITMAHILDPNCSAFSFSIKLPSQRFKEQQSLSGFYCRDELDRVTEYWANDDNVREALHIRKGSKGDWVICNADNFTRTLDDVRAYHLNLSKKGYRSLIFSGDHDMIVPHQSTQLWIKELNYSVTDPWRSWKFRGQIAGYTESYSNMMTFATVKGGGHAAPESNPDECFAMFKRWISHQPL